MALYFQTKIKVKYYSTHCIVPQPKYLIMTINNTLQKGISNTILMSKDQGCPTEWLGATGPVPHTSHACATQAALCISSTPRHTSNALHEPPKPQAFSTLSFPLMHRTASPSYYEDMLQQATHCISMDAMLCSQALEPFSHGLHTALRARLLCPTPKGKGRQQKLKEEHRDSHIRVKAGGAGGEQSWTRSLEATHYPFP